MIHFVLLLFVTLGLGAYFIWNKLEALNCRLIKCCKKLNDNICAVNANVTKVGKAVNCIESKVEKLECDVRKLRDAVIGTLIEQNYLDVQIFRQLLIRRFTVLFPDQSNTIPSIVAPLLTGLIEALDAAVLADPIAAVTALNEGVGQVLAAIPHTAGQTDLSAVINSVQTAITNLVNTLNCIAAQ